MRKHFVNTLDTALISQQRTNKDGIHLGFLGKLTCHGGGKIEVVGLWFRIRKNAKVTDLCNVGNSSGWHFSCVYFIKTDTIQFGLSVPL